MKKGILIVLDIKDDAFGHKIYQVLTMINSLYYPLCERAVYSLEGEKLEKCLNLLK